MATMRMVASQMSLTSCNQLAQIAIAAKNDWHLACLNTQLCASQDSSVPSKRLLQHRHRHRHRSRHRMLGSKIINKIWACCWSSDIWNSWRAKLWVTWSTTTNWWTLINKSVNLRKLRIKVSRQHLRELPESSSRSITNSQIRILGWAKFVWTN